MQISKESLERLEPLYLIVHFGEKGEDILPTTTKSGVLLPQWSHTEDEGYWVKKEVTVFKDFKWLRKGDVIYLNYNTIRGAFGRFGVERFTLDCEGQTYLVIMDINAVMMCIRDGVIISPPNKVVLESVPIENNQKTDTLYVPQMAQESHYNNIFKVVAVGEYVEDEHNPIDIRPEVGRTILIGFQGGVPIMGFRAEMDGKEHYLARMNEIMGYVEI